MVVPIWYHPSVDVNVKGLDPEVLDRLAQQAEAEGVSRQEWIRQVLGRTAAPLSPAELVADAGGLLVLAGLLEGEPPEAGEVLALDATSLLVAEWFPVRSVAVEAATAVGGELAAESTASLICTEQLGVDLVTTKRDLSSTRVRVWRC